MAFRTTLCCCFTFWLCWLPLCFYFGWMVDKTVDVLEVLLVKRSQFCATSFQYEYRLIPHIMPINFVAIRSPKTEDIIEFSMILCSLWDFHHEMCTNSNIQNSRSACLKNRRLNKLLVLSDFKLQGYNDPLYPELLLCKP